MSEFLINGKVLGSGMGPAEIRFHAVFHNRFPRGLIRKDGQGAIDGIPKIGRFEFRKREARTLPGLRIEILNRIRQTSR